MKNNLQEIEHTLNAATKAIVIYLTLLFVSAIIIAANAQTVTTVTTVKDKAGKVLRKDSTTSGFIIKADTITLPGTVRDTCTTAPPKPPDPDVPSSNNIIHKTTFEGVSWTKGGSIKADIGSSWSNTQGCCTYSVTPAPIAHTGSGAMKLDLRMGDPLVSSSSRAGIQSGGGTGTYLAKTDGSEFWYKAWYYVEKRDDGMDQSFIQFHQNQSDGIPPFALWCSSNQFIVVNNGNPNSRYTFTKKDVPIGRWFSVALHIKWSTGSDGFWEFYLDGTQVGNRSTGATNQYSTGYYLKLDLYKWTWEGKKATDPPTSRVIYIDDFYIYNKAATLQEVLK